MNPLIYGLIVTLFGMGIVFLVLMLLWFILTQMRIIFADSKKAKVQPAAAKDVAVAAPIEAVPQKQEEHVDSDELIAVITAAISACMGTQSSLVVRKITRISDDTPAWGQAGRQEQMLNRF